MVEGKIIIYLYIEIEGREKERMRENKKENGRKRERDRDRQTVRLHSAYRNSCYKLFIKHVILIFLSHIARSKYFPNIFCSISVEA